MYLYIYISTYLHIYIAIYLYIYTSISIYWLQKQVETKCKDKCIFFDLAGNLFSRHNALLCTGLRISLDRRSCFSFIVLTCFSGVFEVFLFRKAFSSIVYRGFWSVSFWEGVSLLSFQGVSKVFLFRKEFLLYRFKDICSRLFCCLIIYLSLFSHWYILMHVMRLYLFFPDGVSFYRLRCFWGVSKVFLRCSCPMVFLNTIVSTRCPPLLAVSWHALLPATHCNTLQHTATHCNTMQHNATHCNTLQHTATYCNTLQHTAQPSHS